MLLLEKFVVILYNKPSDHITGNNAKMNLFTKKDRQLETIPPIKVNCKKQTNVYPEPLPASRMELFATKLTIGINTSNLNA